MSSRILLITLISSSDYTDFKKMIPQIKKPKQIFAVFNAFHVCVIVS